MMELAEKTGRQKAHDLIDQAVSESLNGISFKEALYQSEEIVNHLSEDRINELLSGKLHFEMAARSARQLLETIT